MWGKSGELLNKVLKYRGKGGSGEVIRETQEKIEVKKERE